MSETNSAETARAARKKKRRDEALLHDYVQAVIASDPSATVDDIFNKADLLLLEFLSREASDDS